MIANEERTNATPVDNDFKDVRRFGYDRDERVYAWERRFLPPDCAEWRRRVGILIAELRAAEPCGGVLAMQLGERTLYCPEGTVIRTALDNMEAGLIPGVLEPRYDVTDQDYEQGITLEEVGDGIFPGFLHHAGERLADHMAQRHRISVIDYSDFTQDDEAGAESTMADPYRKWGMTGLSPEASLWFGFDVGPAGPLTKAWSTDLAPALNIALSRKHNCRVPGYGTLAAFCDELYRDGANPLAALADILEHCLQPGRAWDADIWHPHIYARCRAMKDAIGGRPTEATQEES